MTAKRGSVEMRYADAIYGIVEFDEPQAEKHFWQDQQQQ